jgi:Ca2+-binding EF-hand superfamily protein
MEQCDLSDKANIGQPGYTTRLVNLPVVLKKYEGSTICNTEVLDMPSRRSSGLFNIEVLHEEETPIQLTLSGKHLEPFLDASRDLPNRLQLAKLQKTGYYNECVESGDSGVQARPGASSNNRSSVKLAYEKFIQQFRLAVNDRSGKLNSTAKQVLVEMDENGNGMLDKRELLLGAHVLGISVSANELEMVWPLLTPDVEGNCLIDELLEIVMMSTKGTQNAAIKHAREQQMLALQKNNRHDRISKKTVLVERLADLSMVMRANLTAKLSEKSITSDEAFNLLDCDNSNTINKQEFHAGLERLGVPLAAADLEAIWPMFNLDQAGTITKHEWKKFIDDKVAWSYKLVADRFSVLASAKDAVKLSVSNSKGVGPRRSTNPAGSMPHLGIRRRPKARRLSMPDLAPHHMPTIKPVSRSKRRFSNPDMLRMTTTHKVVPTNDDIAS